MSNILKAKYNQFSYTIQLPKSYNITSQKLEEIKESNPGLLLEQAAENSLRIGFTDKETFRDYEYFTLKLPGLHAEIYREWEEYGEDIHFEYDSGKEEIRIKMSIFGLIGLLTGAIFASLFFWAKSRKSGRVYSDPTGYELTDPRDGNQKIERIPDISYVDYSKASEAEQDRWNSRIPISPTLAVEVVSAKNGLKAALEKMQDTWMATGTDIGLVVCPFSKKIYIFEKGQNNYSTQSIFDDFQHPLLPDYKDNFSEYAKKIN